MSGEPGPTLSTEAMQVLRLVLQDVAIRLYPDTWGDWPIPPIEFIRREAPLKKGLRELWRFAGHPGTPAEPKYP